MARILLVEDDVELAESLSEALTAQSYAVDVAPDGAVGWSQARQATYDLALLDWTLPQIDGITLCQRLRMAGYLAPILMLTARDTSTDKVVGLDAGADVYIVKPFDLQELLAQIRALLRRGSPGSLPILRWGPLLLNPATYEVTYGDRPVSLTPKEFAILQLLLRNGRRVLSRAVIIDCIWPEGNAPEAETIKTHIKSLRQKLRMAGAPKAWIETVHSLGYRLWQL